MLDSPVVRIGLMLFLLASPAFGRGHDVVLPAGSTVDLRLATPLSSDTARKGDVFRATVVASARTALPEGTVVTGRVEEIRSGDGGSGAIAVSFDGVQAPGGQSVSIHGALASVHQDERRPAVEGARVATGPAVDVVLVGDSPEGARATTLVGIRGQDDGPMAKAWSRSGLLPGAARVSAGAILTMTVSEEARVPVP
jgi:hypothetical protein